MRRWLALAAACLALSGCVATQKDVLEIENQSDELKHQILDLKQTISTLQGSISSLQGNQADLSVDMKQLHTDMSAFTETVKESQGSMVRLSSKLDDMQAGVTNKVASLGESLSSQQAKMAADQAKVAAEQKAALAKASGPTPTELFQNAEVRLAKKDYALAAKGFEDYIAKFPNGALIDVATYNLGEAHFGLKHWKDAGRQFGLFLERYPKSDLTPSTRLMYALCLVNLKENLDEAKQYLESVLADFPKSPEAKAAAKQLQKLKPAKAEEE